MTYLIASAAPRTAKRNVCRAGVGATLMTAAASSALAQAQPPAAPRAAPAPRAGDPPKARPAAGSGGAQKPAAPAPQQQAQGNGEQPQLIFSPLGQLCNKDADPKAKKVCVTVKDGRVESGLLRRQRCDHRDGWRAEEASAHEPALGVNLQYGTRLIVDAEPADDRAVRTLPAAASCRPAGASPTMTRRPT